MNRPEFLAKKVKMNQYLEETLRPFFVSKKHRHDDHERHHLEMTINNCLTAERGRGIAVGFEMAKERAMKLVAEWGYLAEEKIKAMEPEEEK